MNLEYIFKKNQKQTTKNPKKNQTPQKPIQNWQAFCNTVEV